ncbi:MAG: ABC transporter substrate-binding protein [Nitrospirae bacterium]|nr:ABC transporter substrate-binding protein [Nitrospirota bacterium]
MKGISRRKFLKGAAILSGAAAFNVSPAFLKYGLGEQPIKWGSLHPLTGGLAEMAADQKLAVEIAIEDINAAGGVMGRPVVGVFRDTEFSGEVARRKAVELMEKEKIDLLAGALSGPEELALNDLAKKNNIFYGCYTQYMVDSKDTFHKYTFTANVTPFQSAAAGAIWAAENIKGKRWHLLADNYSWPKMFVPVYERIAKQRGADWTGVTWAPFPSTDYSSYIPKVQAVKPDVLFCVCWGSGHINLIKQLQEFGVAKDIKVLFAVSDLPWAVAAGPGKFSDIHAGMLWFWGLEKKYPATKEFNKKFFAKQKRYSAAYGCASYELTRMTLDTAKEIKSLDHAKLSKALEGHKFKYLKGETWVRPCDHDYIGEFFIVKGKPANKMANNFDHYDLVYSVSGEDAAMPCGEKGL